ncbi:MAG TPA: MurT ligase domain-containing protein [Solirubrobacteraceae bacterium]
MRGGGGTSLPGKTLVRLRADAVAQLAQRLPEGCVIVSATNGKTTTAALAASVLERSGIELVHNSAGANMEGGIASTLLQGSGAQLGLFEIDEAWVPQLTASLQPKLMLLGNLFRDQLDRYGELEAIAERWAQTLGAGGPGEHSQLLLNADDPLIADLGRQRERTLHFGIEDDSVALQSMAHAADAKRCRRCGAAYVFDAVYLGHLGRYHCPACGQRRPQPQITASEIELRGVESASFTLQTPEGNARVQLSLPGLYNVYNALGAAALGFALGVPTQQIAESLSVTQAAFGRAELVELSGRPLKILLVKNPAGANEVLRTLALQPGQHDLLCVLNDRIADGRDVSWVWDADFEMLAQRVRRVTCSGSRAPEMALRLKYAGVDPQSIVVIEQLPAALDAAIADAPQSRLPLYALPTYTAMLDLRSLLLSRGVTGERWSA